MYQYHTDSPESVSLLRKLVADMEEIKKRMDRQEETLNSLNTQFKELKRKTNRTPENEESGRSVPHTTEKRLVPRPTKLDRINWGHIEEFGIKYGGLSRDDGSLQAAKQSLERATSIAKASLVLSYDDYEDFFEGCHLPNLFRSEDFGKAINMLEDEAVKAKPCIPVKMAAGSWIARRMLERSCNYERQRGRKRKRAEKNPASTVNNTSTSDGSTSHEGDKKSQTDASRDNQQQSSPEPSRPLMWPIRMSPLELYIP